MLLSHLFQSAVSSFRKSQAVLPASPSSSMGQVRLHSRGLPEVRLSCRTQTSQHPIQAGHLVCFGSLPVQLCVHLITFWVSSGCHACDAVLGKFQGTIQSTLVWLECGLLRQSSRCPLSDTSGSARTCVGPCMQLRPVCAARCVVPRPACACLTQAPGIAVAVVAAAVQALAAPTHWRASGCLAAGRGHPSV